MSINQEKRRESMSMLGSSIVSVSMDNWRIGDLADIVSGIPSIDSWQFSTAVDSSHIFGDHSLFNTPAGVGGDGSVLRLDGNDNREEEIIKMMINNSTTQQPANCNNNIFSRSRLLQISPNHVSPPCGSPAEKALPAKRVQISSPGNTGIKRRQAKTVMCIPATTPANSVTRSSGEVVPSDLWAWRKYGQKPIKGSPYPRGYYRCSSSKGCSARKLVERSRNDPNMLVITYTSEHNHPWPTQKNALAGSTRSQHNKLGINPKSKSITPNFQPHKIAAKAACPKEDNMAENSMVDSNSVTKEEQMDSSFGSEDDFGRDHTLLSYKPIFQDYNLGHCDDLFADLGDIDADSFGLLLGQDKGSNFFDNWNMGDNFKDTPFCVDQKGGLL